MTDHTELLPCPFCGGPGTLDAVKKGFVSCASGKHAFIMLRWESWNSRAQSSPDPDCVCLGNWRAIVKDCIGLIGKRYKDRRGNEFVFFGLVVGEDDYYYGMYGKSGLQLLSCVGSIEGYGFSMIAASKEE